MVHAFTTDVPIREEMYRKIVDQISPEPMSGCLMHLCVRRPDGSLYYIDVWEDEEICGRAFDERIHPAVDVAFGGQRPSSEPVTHSLEVIDAGGALLGAVPS